MDQKFAGSDGWDAQRGRRDGWDAQWDRRMVSLERCLTAALDRAMTDARNAQMRTLLLTQLAAVLAIIALAVGLR